MDSIRSQGVVVGGGPAGIMLAYLLARSGVDVHVLEKHADFFRDFRGDTIHPSTMDVLSELGLLESFLEVPHQELARISLSINGEVIDVGDFSHLDTVCKFIAFAPQWDFLNWLTEQARQYPGFHLHMNCEAQDLIWEGERVIGVLARTPDGDQRFEANLVVAADGRRSRMRQVAKLPVRNFGVPIDVLWMRLPKPEGVDMKPLAYLKSHRFLVLIDRESYFQAAWLIAKGQYEVLRVNPIEELQNSIVEVAPFLKPVIGGLDSWDKLSLLTVRIDRLTRWWLPGLLCIGDSAHAMSPAGGVGINLAIQDAVAAANQLAGPLREDRLTAQDLAAVQERREKPTKQFQTMQVFLHRFIVNPQAGFAIHVFKFLLKTLPPLRRLLAQRIGIGFLPEHVHTETRT